MYKPLEDLEIVYNIQFWDCYNDEMIEETDEEINAHKRLHALLTKVEKLSEVEDFDLVGMEYWLSVIADKNCKKHFEDLIDYTKNLLDIVKEIKEG